MYDFVEEMVREHTYINRMSAVVKAALNKFIATDKIDIDDFRKMRNFIREYADQFHHGKEEVFLFKDMAENMGEDGKIMINDVMLPEHVMGRRFMKNLNAGLNEYEMASDDISRAMAKLKIIANAGGWAFMINEHIYKEDNKVFVYGDKNLAHDKVDEMQKACDEFDKRQHALGIPEYHIGVLMTLEEKYIFIDIISNI